MSNLYILNYHTITPRWGFDVACRTLDLMFTALKAFCRVVPLDEVCSMLAGGTPPSRTTVAVTFDDGYADTFVYACPLCKKHGIRPTLFPIASRITSDETLRPSLFDHWNGKVAYRDLYATVPGEASNRDFLHHGRSSHFMSAAELRKASEFMDIGSHASVHELCFWEDRCIDLYDGGNGNSCNQYAYEEPPRPGYPLFPDRSTIAVERGFVLPEVKAFITAIDKKYFLQPTWKSQLRLELAKSFSRFLSFETARNRRQRVELEIVAAKQHIEAIVGQSVRYFAYPYGQHDIVSEEIVRRYFDAAFTTDIDIVRMTSPLHLVPRAKVHRDIASFLSRLVKFSKRK